MKAMFYDCGVEDKNEDALCALPMDVEVIPRIGETVDMGPEMHGYVGNVVWRYRAEGSKYDVVIFVYPPNGRLEPARRKP